MKELNFLHRLKKEGKLKVVEPSEEIKESYLGKAEDSLKSAKILLQSDLYENSIAMSYYVMYNSLTALLYKTGIKCENHTGSILLLKLVFHQENLFKKVMSAKEERIDKQYYVTNRDEFQLNKQSTLEMIENAEDFLVEIKLILENTQSDKMKTYRTKLLELMIIP